MTKSSLASIGAHCGGKDHATVLHACRTVNNLQETDKQFRGYLEDRRPNSLGDPYRIAGRILQTIQTVPTGAVEDIAEAVAA